MERPTIKIEIPEEYIENERIGLCKVCGKPKSQFNKCMKKYCSDTCRWKYEDCFKTWDRLKGEILLRDNKKCRKCGSSIQPEVDHIKAYMNQGDFWEKDNLQILCHKCHIEKTKSDFQQKETKKNFYKNEQSKLLENS